MVYMDTNESNTHADPMLGSRWAQMWVHMGAQTLVIILVYVTKGNTPQRFMQTQSQRVCITIMTKMTNGGQSDVFATVMPNFNSLLHITNHS